MSTHAKTHTLKCKYTMCIHTCIFSHTQVHICVQNAHPSTYMHTWTYTCIHAFPCSCTHTTHICIHRDAHTHHTEMWENTNILKCLFWDRFSHRTSRSVIRDSCVLGLQRVIWSGLESLSLVREPVWAPESCGKCEVQRRWVSHKCLRISQWSDHSLIGPEPSPVLSTACGHSFSFPSFPSHCCYHCIISQNSFGFTCSLSLSPSIRLS